ncbi:MAG: hypothetical protein RIF37_07780 [Rhodospirillaceae bacterium]
MKWSEIPIPVLVSSGIIVFFLVVFVGSFPFLTSNLEEAQSDNRRLQNDLRSTQSAISRAQDDYTFVVENERRFEEAMASDEIVPHTRRAAARQMQTVALENGLTALNYNFAVASGNRGRNESSASATDGYTLHVENIDLDVGAPLDRPIYAFIEDLVRSIPGTAIIKEFEVQRAENISTEMLNRVAKGENSGIVSGTMQFSWRTAQANKKEDQ